MKTDFEKLNELWGAIRDVDKIYNSTSGERIDNLINAVKNINKSEFHEEAQNKIITGFREGLLNIYKELFNNLNKGIDNIGGLAPVSNVSKVESGESIDSTVNQYNNINNGSTQEYFSLFTEDNNVDSSLTTIAAEKDNNSLTVIDDKNSTSLFNGFSAISED